MAERNYASEIIRYSILVRGTVQGVGFRPFVFNLARQTGVYGSVLNTGGGVKIEAEGTRASLQDFIKGLKEQPPPLAVIEGTEITIAPPAGYSDFEIITSIKSDGVQTLIPADIAVCADCSRDISSPGNRYFSYPFTNCTNCGPRFTIVHKLPYDRQHTVMRDFPMCPACAAEYADPTNRRFHAQPVACAVCGPQVQMSDNEGRPIPGNWLENSWQILDQGGVLALKGLGGFHLVCDAKNPDAVAKLRRRKNRPEKPFAVMVQNLVTAQKYCSINAVEKRLLTSPQAPIVVLQQAGAELPENLAPNLYSLGVMLPYTPLHLLLFSGKFDMLVMTSANRSNMPLIKDNEEALLELKGIADYYLLHNRDILTRCDDSVVAVVDEEVQFWRRSRGYVPTNIKTGYGFGPPVLGIGGEMKNTFCILKEGQAYLSQHIGELDSLEGQQSLLTSLEDIQRLLKVAPQVVGYDMHPDYQVSKLAKKIPVDKHFAVQHHHAHLASCLADNGMDEKVVGLILDGTGYGPDGTLWGFEVLTGDCYDYQREIYLEPVPLPGGERAIKEPWRSATAYLVSLLGEEGRCLAKDIFAPQQALPDVLLMLDKRINSPLSTSCGRLFDAVAAILGVCQHNTYEGQAAIELSELITQVGVAAQKHFSPYAYRLVGDRISFQDTIREIIQERQQGNNRAHIAKRFQDTVIAALRESVHRLAEEKSLDTVALSGGSWQGKYLLQTTQEILAGDGFKVLTHKQVPTNDGGICLGQAAVAFRRWKECV